jgi:hypothetical protein
MKRVIIMILMPLLVLAPAAVLMEPAYACGKSPAAQQVGNGVDETTTSPTPNCGDTGVNKAINTAVNILSLIVGAAAVIAIISSGFKYITSGGDAGKVGNAKNTLIYALIGVALAVLAQLIVRLVITTSNTAANPCPSNATISINSPACK